MRVASRQNQRERLESRKDRDEFSLVRFKCSVKQRGKRIFTPFSLCVCVCVPPCSISLSYDIEKKKNLWMEVIVTKDCWPL
mmetsp:Transcript_26673/g.29525  ORF Transcript_26673/g.29525 Transcript_26673/m.29525 type:complete len:81 (-) Transcript_26673:53-295(-)